MVEDLDDLFGPVGPTAGPMKTEKDSKTPRNDTSTLGAGVFGGYGNALSGYGNGGAKAASSKAVSSSSSSSSDPKAGSKAPNGPKATSGPKASVVKKRKTEDVDLFGSTEKAFGAMQQSADMIVNEQMGNLKKRNKKMLADDDAYLMNNSSSSFEGNSTANNLMGMGTVQNYNDSAINFGGSEIPGMGTVNNFSATVHNFDSNATSMNGLGTVNNFDGMGTVLNMDSTAMNFGSETAMNLGGNSTAMNVAGNSTAMNLSPFGNRTSSPLLKRNSSPLFKPSANGNAASSSTSQPAARNSRPRTGKSDNSNLKVQSSGAASSSSTAISNRQASSSSASKQLRPSNSLLNDSTSLANDLESDALVMNTTSALGSSANTPNLLPHGLNSIAHTPTIVPRIIETASDRPASCQPIVHNCVASFMMKADIDVKDANRRLRNSEYNPKKGGGALIVRVKEPRATALVHENGKVTITGAKGAAEAKLAGKKLAKMFTQIFPSKDIKFANFKVLNLIAVADLGFPVRLEAVAHDYKSCASYEPEMFCGLVWKMWQPKISLNVYVSGKMVITGGKTVEEIDLALDEVYAKLRDYQM